MFRYHRVLYRRLLRGQSSEQLVRLSTQSHAFPEIARMIDDELARRDEYPSRRCLNHEDGRRSAPVRLARAGLADVVNSLQARFLSFRPREERARGEISLLPSFRKEGLREVLIALTRAMRPDLIGDSGIGFRVSPQVFVPSLRRSLAACSVFVLRSFFASESPRPKPSSWPPP